MQLVVLTALGLGLIGGQLTSLPLFANARITLLDISVLIVLLYGAYQSRKKRFIPPHWAPILSFAAVALISLAATWGHVPTYVVGGGLLYVFRWIVYAALYWVSASAVIPAASWFALLIGSSVAIGLIGMLQYVWYPDLRNLYYLGWDPHYQRLFSTLLDPNFTGILLGMAAIMLLSVMGKGKSSAWKLAGLSVTVVSLILTYSRSSIAAFAVGLIVLGIVTKRTMLIIGVTVLLVIGLVLAPRTGEGQNLFRTVSSYARLGNAERGLSLIREKPVMGHGFNILRFIATERSWIDERTAPSRAGNGLDASLLFVGATTGIVGIAVYGWLLVSFIRLGLSGIKAKPAVRTVAAGYLASCAALLVHSLFINSLFYPWVLVWTWVGFGAMERYIKAGK